MAGRFFVEDQQQRRGAAVAPLQFQRHSWSFLFWGAGLLLFAKEAAEDVLDGVGSGLLGLPGLLRVCLTGDFAAEQSA